MNLFKVMLIALSISTIVNGHQFERPDIEFESASMFLIRTGNETGFYFGFNSKDIIEKNHIKLAITQDHGETWKFIFCKHLSLIRQENLEDALEQICFGTTSGYIFEPNRYKAALVFEKNPEYGSFWDDNYGKLYNIEILQ